MVFKTVNRKVKVIICRTWREGDPGFYILNDPNRREKREAG